MNHSGIPWYGRFQTRLLLLVLLILLPALALAVFTNFNQRHAEKRRAVENAGALARLVAAKEESFLKNTRQLLGTLAQFPLLAQGTNRTYGEMIFNNLRKLSPDYVDFGLIEADGLLFGCTIKQDGPVQLAGQAYFDLVKQTQRFAVGDYSKDGLVNRPNLCFGYPLLAPDGQVRRVFYAALNLELIGATAAQVPLPPGAELTVLDRRGTVLARLPDHAIPAGHSLAQDPAVQRLLRQPDGNFEMTGSDGVARLYAVAGVRDGTEPSLFVSVAIPTAVSYAGANEVLVSSLLILGVVATLVLAAGHFYARRFFLHPVTALAAAAQRLARGDFSARTGIGAGQGELHELAQAFDDMAATLQQRQDQLEAANQEIRHMNAALEQRVLDRTAQLESANRELEAFSYSTSHDLRAPLRHIGGFAQMLQRRASEQLDAEGRRYLTVIADSSKRMGCLIDDLLIFSRMGRQSMSFTHVSSNALVRQVQAEVAAEHPGRAIDWVIGDLPDVQADMGLLRQVWLNLIRNAIKYSQPRERSRVEIGVSGGTEGEIVFFVRDNGVGFDMQYAGKLFGVFQRLHAESEFEGTGIGLANVRRIISRHGGRTWAESRLDEGATFYFSLPLPKSIPAQN